MFEILTDSSVADGSILDVLWRVLWVSFLTIIAVGFTSHGSFVRFALLVPVSLMTWAALQVIYDICGPGFKSSYLGSWLLVLYLQYVDVALITRWTWDTYGPSKRVPGLSRPSKETHSVDDGTADWRTWVAWTAGRFERERVRLERADAAFERSLSSAIKQRTLFGLHALTDFRGVDRPWESRNVPHFNFRDYPQIQLFNCFEIIVSTPICLCAKWLIPYLNDFYFFAIAISPDPFPYFFRYYPVRAHKLLVRVFVTFFTAVLYYVSSSGLYSLLTFLAVASGATTIELWPHLFAGYRTATTLQEFWGRTMPQLHRRRFYALADCIIYGHLGFQRHRTTPHLILSLLVFTLSGICHTGANLLNPEVRWYEHAEVKFFLMQWVGVAAEILLVPVILKVAYRNFKKKSVKRGLGWMGPKWVVVWLVYTVPMLAYPMILGQRREGQRWWEPLEPTKTTEMM